MSGTSSHPPAPSRPPSCAPLSVTDPDTDETWWDLLQMPKSRAISFEIDLASPLLDDE